MLRRNVREKSRELFLWHSNEFKNETATRQLDTDNRDDDVFDKG